MFRVVRQFSFSGNVIISENKNVKSIQPSNSLLLLYIVGQNRIKFEYQILHPNRLRTVRMYKVVFILFSQI
ncbi:unnamed protein product [Parnassius mnemosyne]|uniref:Uncharacterized protein n=1 Tax=Parnassius mnemosyne TaxID=213953 RepID=A0AAV1LEK4_9NEOP